MNKAIPTLIARVLMCGGILGATPALADPARHLGSTRLARAENDKDVLRFTKCKRGIDAIQLRVERGQIEVEKLWVRFAKGGVDRLDVRERIPPGGESRWIDLLGGERCLKLIGVIGDTELSIDQARLEIYGR